MLALWVARNAAAKVRPGGTLLFMGGTGGRRVGPGLGLVSAVTAAMPPLTASLALELAPIRVNLIAAGFVDTPLSATLLGADLDARRQELRSTLPIRRVVEPSDVAALAGLPGYAVVHNGKKKMSGGTSAAAPLWAALIARIAARPERPPWCGVNLRLTGAARHSWGWTPVGRLS